MARWRSLDDYSPFARLLVEYMWTQRPPLLPAGFADRMGISKQVVSKWLNTPSSPDADLVIQIARRMPMPVSMLFAAAGFTTPDYPIFDIAEAWAFVQSRVQESMLLSAEQREHIIEALSEIQQTDPPTLASLRSPTVEATYDDDDLSDTDGSEDLDNGDSAELKEELEDESEEGD